MVKEAVWHRLLKRPYRLKKVIDVGDGDIDIVLVHGLASKSEAWEPLIKVLDKKKYRIRSFDLLGFGLSPKPSHLKYSTKDHARAIIHSLNKDSKSRNQQYIFVGHSMGCIITTHIAYMSSNKVRAAVLYKPPLLLNKSEKRSLHTWLYGYVATKPSVVVIYGKLAAKLGRKSVSFHSRSEDWLPFKNSLSNTILAQQTLNELKFINKPTHIVFGRFDFMVSKIKAKKLETINPSLRLHYVTEMHDIKPKSSKYLNSLINGL